MFKKIIAIDFDGTIVTNKWPEIGEPIRETFEKYKREKELGTRFMLWTCRSGDFLEEAVKTCKELGYELDTINEPLPDVCEYFGGDSRKIFANEYWDDRGVTMPQGPIGEISDGYHTFNELYHHRAILFSVICNDHKRRGWKSKHHSDGTMYDRMFIVGISTPKGQATYHYDIEPYWDMFNVKELDHAPEWDGHSPDQAIERIASLKSFTKYKYI